MRPREVTIGPEQVLANSSFAYESAPNITHATNADGTRTLCGRACENWISQAATPPGLDEPLPPDCLTCRRIWEARRAVAAQQTKRRQAGLCVSCGSKPDGRCPNEWTPDDDGRKAPPRGKHTRVS